MTDIIRYLCRITNEIKTRIVSPHSKYYVEVYDIHGKPMHFNNLPQYRCQTLELIIYTKSLRRSKAYGLWKEVSYAGKINDKGISTIEFINAKTREIEQTFYGFSLKI